MEGRILILLLKGAIVAAVAGLLASPVIADAADEPEIRNDTPLAVHSGVDFPAWLAELLLGDARSVAAAARRPYRVGVRAFNLELTVLWMATVLAGRRRYPFLSYPSRREVVAVARGLLDPQRRFDILSRDDPRPGLAELFQIARKVAWKITGALRGSNGDG